MNCIINAIKYTDRGNLPSRYHDSEAHLADLIKTEIIPQHVIELTQPKYTYGYQGYYDTRIRQIL